MQTRSGLRHIDALRLEILLVKAGARTMDTALLAASGTGIAGCVKLQLALAEVVITKNVLVATMMQNFPSPFILECVASVYTLLNLQ